MQVSFWRTWTVEGTTHHSGKDERPKADVKASTRSAAYAGNMLAALIIEKKGAERLRLTFAGVTCLNSIVIVGRA